jgi:hypothetical protein
MKLTQRNDFIKKLKALVVKQEKANKAKDPNSGSIVMSRKMSKEDVGHCRGEVELWEGK